MAGGVPSGFGVSRYGPVRVGVHLVLERRRFVLPLPRGDDGGVGRVTKQAGGSPPVAVAVARRVPVQRPGDWRGRGARGCRDDGSQRRRGAERRDGGGGGGGGDWSDGDGTGGGGAGGGLWGVADHADTRVPMRGLALLHLFPQHLGLLLLLAVVAFTLDLYRLLLLLPLGASRVVSSAGATLLLMVLLLLMMSPVLALASLGYCP